MDDLITTQDNAVALPQLELEIKFYLGQTAQNIIEVGKRLIQAKSLVNHGHWQNWLEKNFQLSQASATRFMNCAERFGNLTTLQGLKSSQMIALLSLPSAEETEKFIAEKAAEGKAVAEMTIKELREEIAEHKKKIAAKDETIAARDKIIDDNKKAYQESLFKLNEEHKKEVTDLKDELDDVQSKLADKTDKLEDAEKELKERPTVTVPPEDYQQTKDELVDVKVKLGVANKTIEKRDATIKEQSEAHKKAAAAWSKERKKLNERLNARAEFAAQVDESAPPPMLFIGNGIGFVPDEPYKLLLTDPPYSTDVDDVDEFAQGWLPNALKYVRHDGFAYVFVGAYPDELRAYLNITPPEHLALCQVLVWTYRNTLGNNPKDRYKLNWQACLFYRGVDAPNLNCPETSQQWAVQDINAPDGRLGNRDHTWQKPKEIAERFVFHSTQKGDTVFDPFACTGTFLLTAAKLGRKAYGFEINPEHAAIAFKGGCINGSQL